MEQDMAGVTKASFGKLKSGAAVEQYTLTNKNGLVAKIMTYGATLTELHVPDKDGKLGKEELAEMKKAKAAQAAEKKKTKEPKETKEAEVEKVDKKESG